MDYVFDKIGIYDIKACVLNRNFKVSCRTLENYEINNNLFVVATAEVQTEADRVVGSQAINIKLGGGTPPYNVYIDWGDGAIEDILNNPGLDYPRRHTYTVPAGTTAEYTVAITAQDSTCIECSTGRAVASVVVAVYKNADASSEAASAELTTGSEGAGTPAFED
jgi:hypothetical protein